MAISTYTELQAAVDAYLGHGLFTARVPDFITMFEASVNRRLRVFAMEDVQELELVGGGVYITPEGYLGWRSVHWIADDRRVALEYVTPDYFNIAYSTDATGVPTIFTILDDRRLHINTTDESGTVVMSFFAQITALSDNNASNWLLEAHPDIYLFGVLCEAELFGVNDTRAALWKARRDEIFEEIEKLSNRQRGAGRVRLVQATP